MWVEPKPIGIYNHSRRSNIFSSDEKNYLRGPKMSFMHTICVVCCWRSNFHLVIVTPLAVKINAPGTPSCFKRGRYPACYNQPLLQPAPVSHIDAGGGGGGGGSPEPGKTAFEGSNGLCLGYRGRKRVPLAYSAIMKKVLEFWCRRSLVFVFVSMIWSGSPVSWLYYHISLPSHLKNIDDWCDFRREIYKWCLSDRGIKIIGQLDL